MLTLSFVACSSAQSLGFFQSQLLTWNDMHWKKTSEENERFVYDLISTPTALSINTRN